MKKSKLCASGFRVIFCLIIAVSFNACGKSENIAETYSSTAEEMQNTVSESTTFNIADYTIGTGAGSEPEIDTSIDEGFREGDYHGTLVLQTSDGDIRTKTYYADIAGNGEKAQEIVDADDSAAYFRYDDYHVYADHNDTNFEKLQNTQVGDMAMLVTEDGGTDTLIEKYKCIRVCRGYNYGHIFDEDMNDLTDLDDGSILMYTCRDDYINIYMTFWEVVRE